MKGRMVKKCIRCTALTCLIQFVSILGIGDPSLVIWMCWQSLAQFVQHCCGLLEFMMELRITDLIGSWESYSMGSLCVDSDYSSQDSKVYSGFRSRPRVPLTRSGLPALDVLPISQVNTQFFRAWREASRRGRLWSDRSSS